MNKCKSAGFCDYRERGNICSYEKPCRCQYKEPDLVEVVRCKDCRHYDLMLGWCDIHSHYSTYNGDDRYLFGNEDYCSYGEVRNEINK